LGESLTVSDGDSTEDDDFRGFDADSTEDDDARDFDSEFAEDDDARDSGESSEEDQLPEDKKGSMGAIAKESFTMALYCAVLNIFAEFASTTQELSGNQNPEGWFATHVSNPLIDGLLSDLSGVQLLRGEKMSISSSIRKNQNRDVTASVSYRSEGDGFVFVKAVLSTCKWS